ncbi:MAG: tetratricopeptide repeat protein, partial [Bacteroidota bacterium]
MENKEKADVYCGFGAYNNELGNYEVAVDQFERALTVNPKMDIAWNNLGNAKRSLRQFEEALECYQKAIECSPNRFEFYYHKGILLIELSRFNEAEGVLLEAVKLEPENIDLTFQLASVYKVLRQYDEAVTYYQKCRELSPGNPDVLKNYIGSLYSSGKTIAAEALLKQYLTFPTNDISWFFVLPHEFIAEDKVEAVDQYFNVFKNKYDALYFEWMKGFFFQRVGYTALAASIYKGVLEKDRENQNCSYNLAQILFKEERYAESWGV